jgi:hypothetical protein
VCPGIHIGNVLHDALFARAGNFSLLLSKDGRLRAEEFRSRVAAYGVKSRPLFDTVNPMKRNAPRAHFGTQNGVRRCSTAVIEKPAAVLEKNESTNTLIRLTYPE